MDIIMTIDVINDDQKDIIVMTDKRADNPFLNKLVSGKVRKFVQGEKYALSIGYYYCSKVQVEVKEEHVDILVELIKLNK